MHYILTFNHLDISKHLKLVFTNMSQLARSHTSLMHYSL